MSASFDVAFYIKFFCLALAAEKSSYLFVEIAGLFSFKFDEDVACFVWQNDFVLPVGSGTAARGAHIVNGNRRWTYVFKAKFNLGNDSRLQGSKVVGSWRKPFNLYRRVGKRACQSKKEKQK